MRDVLIIPFNKEESLIVASDNSGAIGLRDMDAVHVPYETVAYYSFRVSVMECMAAGAEPFAVTLQNFCGDSAWPALEAGIQRGITELQFKDIQLTGSTESNFTLLQSAVGITVLGKKKNNIAVKSVANFDPKEIGIAVIGTPLVGNEVIEREIDVAPLALMKRLSTRQDVITWPVGSKGILHEINRMFPNQTFSRGKIETSVDIEKSSGPATCFLIAFPKEKKREIMSIVGEYFRDIILS